MILTLQGLALATLIATMTLGRGNIDAINADFGSDAANSNAIYQLNKATAQMETSLRLNYTLAALMVSTFLLDCLTLGKPLRSVQKREYTTH